VEDLVSEIFVKAWEKLHLYRIRKDVPFGAWLFRIARHTVIDAYRMQRQFDEMPEDVIDQDHFNRADNRLQTNDLLRVVRTAFAALPRRYRDVLSLSYVAGLSHAETARTLRMTEGGVRILKFRALRKLEGLLPPEFKRNS
jgi:RNA polymerase sigma-70 factor (ECF subfamily)